MTLPGGRIFLIDDEDVPLVKMLKWRVMSRKGRATSYVRANIRLGGKRTSIMLHRLLMGLEHEDRREVDHINHDGFDNRRENLRIVTDIQQSMNKRKQCGKYTSKFKGVSEHHGKWRSMAGINGNRVSLGIFETEEGAALAYNAWASTHFGQYAHLNEICTK